MFLCNQFYASHGRDFLLGTRGHDSEFKRTRPYCLKLSPLADDEAYALYYGDFSSTSPSTSLRPKGPCKPAVSKIQNMPYGGSLEGIWADWWESESLFSGQAKMPVCQPAIQTELSGFFCSVIFFY